MRNLFYTHHWPCYFLRHDIAAACLLKMPLNPSHPSIHLSLRQPFSANCILSFRVHVEYYYINVIYIFVRPSGSSNATNYHRRSSFRRRGTSCMERSSSICHRLLISWHFQKMPQDLFVCTVILEHRKATN